MADYPVLDKDGKVIIAQDYDHAVQYPVLDGNGSVIIPAPPPEPEP